MRSILLVIVTQTVKMGAMISILVREISLVE